MEWFMNWWWATILGPVILALVIIYAMAMRRRLSPGEKAAQNRAVDRLYNEPPRADD